MAESQDARITSRWEASELTARSVADPLPQVSFGSTGAFAVVDGPEPDPEARPTPALLTIPVPGEVEATVDWTTMRVFAIDEHERRFDLIERSGFDRERRVAWAEVDGPGLYGAYGLPSDPATREAVWWLRELQPLIHREAALGGDGLRHSICELILCQNPNVIPPQGICERCLGLEIPRGGLPEFGLLRHERLPELIRITPCRLVNGPISYLEFSTNHMFKIPTASGTGALCAQPGPGDLFKPPKWSPGGDRLAYTVRNNSGNSRLEARDSACGSTTVITSGPGDWSWMAWNPVESGGKYQLAFTVGTMVGTAYRWRIDAVLADGTNPQNLVGPASIVSGQPVTDAWCPAYSPDGSALAFLARLGPVAGPDPSLVLAGPTGANAKVVTAPGLKPREPVVWTRDGKFVGSRTLLGQNPFQVGWWFFPVSNGSVSGPPKTVASTDVTSLSFAPDGLHVCGTRDTPSASGELFVADFDPVTLGLSNIVAITADCFGPDWGPICV